MPPARRRFRRPLGDRRYKKIFYVAAEGELTEISYFNLFNNEISLIKVKCIQRPKSSAPLNVLNSMKRFLKEEGLTDTDEAWLVVDKDSWIDDQLGVLYNWSRSKDNYGLALSNPKFEFWLLLHFENGNRINSSNGCSRRLKNHIPDYNKFIDPRIFTPERINQAISRAKIRDNPPCIDWPHKSYGTTVYRLVERIISGIIVDTP